MYIQINELTSGRSSSSESTDSFLRFGGDGSFLIVTGGVSDFGSFFTMGVDVGSFLIVGILGESVVGVDSVLTVGVDSLLTVTGVVEF
jgi:hypothetical protein